MSGPTGVRPQLARSADGDVRGAEAGELVGLGGSAVVDRLGVSNGLQRGDDELGPESSDVAWMTEALEVPPQLVDHEAVEIGQALDERLRSWGAPQQLVESIGVVPEHRCVDKSSTQLLDARLLGPQPVRQLGHERSDLIEVPIRECDEQRVLVREVLVQRSDRDMGSVGNIVRRRRVVPALVENASSLVEDAGVERPRSLLNRSFAGLDAGRRMRIVKHEQYSHNSDMRTVTVHTRLEASADIAWHAVKTPHAFVHVAQGMLRYPAAERLDRPWRVGDHLQGWTFLFGVLPFSYHHITVALIDDAARVVASDEHGGVVRTWRHDVTVTPIDETSCRYDDRIDIDAGIFTPVVATYARFFYRYRQRRWRALARLLTATTV